VASRLETVIHALNDRSKQVRLNRARRNVLCLGASAVPAIVSVRGGSAFAQTQVSLGLANCTVVIAQETVENIEGLPAGAGTARTFDGQEIAHIYDNGFELTGFDARYANYLNSLTAPGSGVSCVASIQLAATAPPDS